MFRRAKSSGKGIVPEHLKERFRYLDGLPPAAILDPWCRLPSVAVGGLWHVGFAPESDLLLVHSVSGRGVIDCATGEKLARDDEEYEITESLEAEGIGPLRGQRIRMSGIYGGGLLRMAADGWSVELHPLSWPEEELFLCPPGQAMLWQRAGSEPGLLKLRPLPSVLTAYGFSPTGKSLVIASASDIEIFKRV